MISKFLRLSYKFDKISEGLKLEGGMGEGLKLIVIK